MGAFLDATSVVEGFSSRWRCRRIRSAHYWGSRGNRRWRQHGGWWSRSRANAYDHCQTYLNFHSEADTHSRTDARSDTFAQSYANTGSTLCSGSSCSGSSRSGTGHSGTSHSCSYPGTCTRPYCSGGD